MDYEVPAGSHRAVTEAIHRLRLMIPDLNQCDAYTTWKVLRAKGIENGLIRTAELRLVAVVRLPRLAAGAPDDVVQCFARYRQRLEEHEQLHVDHGRAAVVEVAELLANVPERIDNDANAVIESAMTTIIDRRRAMDSELDARTDHTGAGLSFPPIECPHGGLDAP